MLPLLHALELLDSILPDERIPRGPQEGMPDAEVALMARLHAERDEVVRVKFERREMREGLDVVHLEVVGRTAGRARRKFMEVGRPHLVPAGRALVDRVERVVVGRQLPGEKNQGDACKEDGEQQYLLPVGLRLRHHDRHFSSITIASSERTVGAQEVVHSLKHSLLHGPPCLASILGTARQLGRLLAVEPSHSA